MKKLVLTGLCILIAFLNSQSFAASRTWDGETDDDWFTAANWNPDGTPVSDDNLTVSSGTTATTANVYTSNGGSITFNNSGTTGSFGKLYTGLAGNGTLNINNGADITSTGSQIANNPGSTGTATVSGSGSTWNNDDLQVGYVGTGTLNIVYGADVNTTGAVNIGRNDTATGTATVSGMGSTWSSNDMRVGTFGTGTLNITDNAELTTLNTAYIGTNSGSIGTMTVDDSTWNAVTAILEVGYYGTGTLNIINGADVTSGTGYIGSIGGSEGTVTVDGYGSSWNTGDFGIYVGNDGTATLNVSNDAQVTTGNFFSIGDKGTVNLSGGKISASHLYGKADSINFTGGELEITDDDVDISGSGPLGSSVSMNNGQVLDVQNGITTIASSSSLSAGNSEVYSSEIQNDGYLTLYDGSLVNTTGGLTNSCSISMSDSTITGAGKVTNDYGAVFNASGTVDPDLDNYGTVDLSGVLTVNGAMENYGSVDIGSSETLRQNYGLDNYGTIELDGGSITGDGAVFNHAGGTIRGGSSIGSDIINDGGLIHADGDSTLLIANSIDNYNGGEMRVDDGAGISVLGYVGNEGTVILDGPNANFSAVQVYNNGTILGQGRISSMVDNDGVVRASGGVLTLAAHGFDNNFDGRIEVLDNSTVFITQGLMSNNGTIALQGGSFDNANNLINNEGSITGHGTFRSAGLDNIGHIGVGYGDLEVIGDVINDGTCDIQFASTAVFYDDVSGSGTFGGTGTAMFLADLSPGSSPGIMSFQTNVVLGSGSMLIMELGGLYAGDEYDVLDVAGELNLDGILDIELINDFVPQYGNIFDILDFDPVKLCGTFDEIYLPSLSEGLIWDTSSLYTVGELGVVPEPATICLLGLGALSLIHTKRK